MDKRTSQLKNPSPKPISLPKAAAAAASSKAPVEIPKITFGAFSPFHGQVVPEEDDRSEEAVTAHDGERT